MSERLVRGFLADVWDAGRAEEAARYVGPEYAAPGFGRGPAAVADNVTSFRQAFPDLRLQVVDSVADDDRVAVWMRLSGTHRGIFRGHAPTGRRAEWDEVGFFTVEEWLLVRGRFLADMFGLRKALGIIPDDVR